MRANPSSDERLRRFFRRHRIATLRDLFKLLHTKSRMTVFRHLLKVDYLTSYSHSGRYYTLRDIPSFDEYGLWFHQGVGFSRTGTLKNTLADLVEAIEIGATHDELRAIVKVRAQYALLELVNAQRISRHRLPAEYLYLSGTPSRAAKQLAAREVMQSRSALSPPVLPASVVIAILLEVIQMARVRINAAEIVTRLGARKVGVTEEQVEETLKRFGIAKKGAR
jgi:hypothetical protein